MQISLTQQLLSFAGAMLILVAYVGHQMAWLDSRRPLYNAVNAAGAALLAWAALHPFQVGFVVLESAWTLISLFAFWKAMRKAPVSA